MGVCASCLGRGRREHHDYESSRLLDDDLYQSSYGYGALNHANQMNQPDPESVKREREALEAICQRTSESVIDIWSLQSQPHHQPRAAFPRSTSNTTAGSGSHADVASASDTLDEQQHPHLQQEPPVTIVSSASSQTASDQGAGGMPKHWGEVVINPRKDRKRGAGADANDGRGRDVFGVLQVS